MNQIDKTKPVLVTGATGYVAGWIVKRLLDEGITVHAAVRNPENTSKVQHLTKAAENSKGEIKLFKADLLTKDAYFEAMQGCELVYHTASPFTLDVKDPQKDLVDPAVLGTKNVLESANKTPTVKRIVVTSSCAAIYTDAIECSSTPGGMLTEEIWNEMASLDYQPYSLSKTLAEKKAWEMQKNQNQWDLVTINPSLVMGPPLNPKAVTSESFVILKQMVDGTMKMGAPRMGIGMVDVRDVADAHYQAGFKPEAAGRYITSAHNSDFFEMASVLRPKYGSRFPLPKKALPKWLVMLVGPMMNKALTKRMIKNNVNIEWKADNSKIKAELGIQFKPMKETMEDSIHAMIEAGEI
jgi:nucleoside-diphosphate-sugar epimerase